MTSISRSLDDAQETSFDLIVVGGGIYGACLTLEAARRGLKPLLIEREDFGGATSLNSLRIIHGGLRYLQHFALGRFMRSVSEQAWWLRVFPDLIEVLPCLMPLYDRGLRRRSVMRVALPMNNLLAKAVRTRFHGRRAGSLLRAASMISRDDTIAAFKMVEQAGLSGGVVWHDAQLSSPPRLMMEILRWSVARGASALNYVVCTGAVEHEGHIAGVRARCCVTNRELEFRARRVVNCTGPWNAEVSKLLGAEIDVQPGVAGAENLIAYNLILARSPLATHALAVSPPTKNGHTYFVVPLGDQTLVGTAYLPAEIGHPTDRHVSSVLADLNSAIPRFEITDADVIDMMVGRLPADTVHAGLPGAKPRVIHHGERGGLGGLVSVIGVKYTTARWVAERTLRQIFARAGQKLPVYADEARPPAARVESLEDLLASPTAASALIAWMNRESVLHIDDLLLRRCRETLAPDDLGPVAERLMATLGWDGARRATELLRLDAPKRLQTASCVEV